MDNNLNVLITDNAINIMSRTEHFHRLFLINKWINMCTHSLIVCVRFSFHHSLDAPVPITFARTLYLLSLSLIVIRAKFKIGSTNRHP